MGFPPGGYTGSKRLGTPWDAPLDILQVKRESLIYTHAGGMIAIAGVIFLLVTTNLWGLFLYEETGGLYGLYDYFM